MNNKQSIYIIVTISLFVALLHFAIGKDYQGVFRDFVRGYLIDILLPMNLYLLLQISLRKNLSLKKARIIAALFVLCFGIAVEILQYYNIKTFGNTFDPLDIVMYAIGVIIGVGIDLTVINKYENPK